MPLSGTQGCRVGASRTELDGMCGASVGGTGVTRRQIPARPKEEHSDHFLAIVSVQ